MSTAPAALAMTAEEIESFLGGVFPQANLDLVSVDLDCVWLRRRVGEADLRPGGTVAGPVLMEIADGAVFVLVLSRIGRQALAVTTNLSINFLRKPAANCDVLAKANVLKLGSRLVIAEVSVFSEGEERPVAHAVVTYSIPPA